VLENTVVQIYAAYRPIFKYGIFGVFLQPPFRREETAIEIVDLA